MHLKSRSADIIEGLGLLLIFFSFGLQVYTTSVNDLRQEVQLYQLHDKLDAVWSVVSEDYASNHPEEGVHGSMNFKSYVDRYKWYSTALKETKPLEQEAEIPTFIWIALFSIGSLMVAIPKLCKKMP